MQPLLYKNLIPIDPIAHHHYYYHYLSMQSSTMKLEHTELQNYRTQRPFRWRIDIVFYDEELQHHLLPKADNLLSDPSRSKHFAGKYYTWCRHKIERNIENLKNVVSLILPSIFVIFATLVITISLKIFKNIKTVEIISKYVKSNW